MGITSGHLWGGSRAGQWLLYLLPTKRGISQLSRYPLCHLATEVVISSNTLRWMDVYSVPLPSSQSQGSAQTGFDVDVLWITTITYIVCITVISISTMRFSTVYSLFCHESSVIVLLSVSMDSFLLIMCLCCVTACFMELCYSMALICCFYCIVGRPQQTSHCWSHCR